MWSALIWLLAVLVIVFIALGATPVRCELRASREQHTRFLVRLHLLGGYAPGMAIVDSARPRKKKKTSKDHRTRATKEKDQKTKRRATLDAVIDLVVGVLGRIRFNHLSVKGRFGTGDPAETGEIYGYLAPLAFGVNPPCPRVNLALEPVFDTACLEGSIVGELEVVPLRLIPPFARFGWRMVTA